MLARSGEPNWRETKYSHREQLWSPVHRWLREFRDGQIMWLIYVLTSQRSSSSSACTSGSMRPNPTNCCCFTKMWTTAATRPKSSLPPTVVKNHLVGEFMDLTGCFTFFLTAWGLKEPNARRFVMLVSARWVDNKTVGLPVTDEY